MKPILRVFIRDDCPRCLEAQQVAVRVEQDFPQLKVEIINMADPHAIVSEAVFATPTYMLNNRIVSLGNPSPAEVARWAAEAALPSFNNNEPNYGNRPKNQISAHDRCVSGPLQSRDGGDG